MRAALELALDSKWDGVRVTAAKALCRWGDEESIVAVKAAMAVLARKPLRWANVGALASALAPHLGPQDAGWAVQLLSEDAHVDNVLCLRPLFDHLREADVMPLLKKALTSATTERRAVALSFMQRRVIARSSAAP